MRIKKIFHLFIACFTLIACLGMLSLGLQAQEPDSAAQSTSLLENIEGITDQIDETTEEDQNNVVRVAPTGTGGPDGFGYTYIDSNEVGGPTYSFVDLPMTGSSTVNFNDDSLHGPYSLNFDFNYYGTDYDQIWISSDGWLSLGSASPPDSDRSNDCALPSTNGANNIVAGIWDDLEHNTGIGSGFPIGKGYFESFAAGSCPYNGYAGACAVTEWDGMFHASGQPDPMTFEILLFDDNNILIQIADDGSEHGQSSTTGIENATGQMGLTYACNSNNSLGNNLAIKFSPPQPSPAYAEEDNYVQAPYYVETQQSFNYTLVISNTGNISSTALLMSNTLPSEVTQTGAATISQQSAGVSGSFVSDFPAAGSAIQWSGMVPVGAGLEIQVPVQVNSSFNMSFVNRMSLADSAMSAPVVLSATSEVYRAGELFLYESFNQSHGGLSGNNEWEWGQAKYGPKQAHSANGLWGLDLDAEYDNNVSSTLTMTLNLTTIPATHTVMLHWWEWVETQSCCDFGSVKISSPSNPTPTTISGPTSGNSGGWVERVQDISTYAGEMVTLNFLFEPNLTVADKGWFIDDIFIRHIGPPVPEIQMKKTVGTDPTTCASTDVITVTAGTTVYYCYEATNSGTITLTEHSLVDNQLGSLLSSSPITLNPSNVSNTNALGYTFSTMIVTDTVNTAVWTASDGTLSNTVMATDYATVTIGHPAITLEKTVGTNPSQCATTDSIQVAAGTVVYYCYRVTNTGDMSLDLHSLNDSLLGNVIPNLPYTLNPGESFTNVDLNILVSNTVNTDTVNSTTWTAYNAGPSAMVSATDFSTVTIGTIGLEFTKTVGTQAGVCANTDVITVSKGTQVYYCYQVTNTGAITLGLHTLNDGVGSQLFNEKLYKLAPGQSVSTVDLNLPISTIMNTSTTNIATWTAYNAGPVDLTVVTDSATVIVSNPIIELKKTVGTQSGVCATTETITVTLGTTVYHCYEVTNKGNVPLALHTLDDTSLGSIFTGFAHHLAPGASLNTIQAGANLSQVIQGNSASVGTWTAYNNNGSNGSTDTATAIAVGQVFVSNPDIELNMTVGTQAGVCATTDTITVVQGTTVYYCYEVVNTGNVALASHTLNDSVLGQLFNGLAHNLAPGDRLTSVQAGVTISTTINAQTINVGTWTAYNNNPATGVIASDFATINVLQPEIEIKQTVGTDPNTCATTDAIEVMVGTTVYYCYQVSNTGQVPFTLHTLDDNELGNVFTGFMSQLAPGETINNISAGILISTIIDGNKNHLSTWTAYNNGPTNVVTATDSTLVMAKQMPLSIEMSAFTVSTNKKEQLPVNILIIGMMLLGLTSCISYRRQAR